MIIKRLLLLLLVAYFPEYVFSSINILEKCDDCVALTSCSAAIAVGDDREHLSSIHFKSICGIDSTKSVVKVCCSYFTQKPPVLDTTTNDDDKLDLENHPNYSLLPKDCGTHLGNRISEGVFATLFEFPWMALLAYRNEIYKGNVVEFRCGGTVINERYILTAAHCLSERDQKLVGVRLGEYNIRTKNDCKHYLECSDKVQDIRIADKFVHPNFTRMEQVQNDIALIRLEKPINFNCNNVHPICLPIMKSLRTKTLSGNIGTVAGWGHTNSRATSNILKKYESLILEQEECKKKDNSDSIKSYTNKICAYENGKDSCIGDNGGPLIVEESYDNHTRMIQYGIVSYGTNQCGISVPGVYTDLRHFGQWILDTIKE